MENNKQSKPKRKKDLYKIPEKEDNTTNYYKLIVVIIISFVFIGGEIVGGIISHSISVISDATHLITDLIGFIISFVFIYYSSKSSDHKISFGFHRMEVLGALANLFIIWVIAIFLLYEATLRIINREFVQNPKVMLIIAGGGLIINIIMYFVLHSGGSHSHGLGGKCDDHGHEESVSYGESQIVVGLCSNCKQPQEKDHKCIDRLLKDEIEFPENSIYNQHNCIKQKKKSNVQQEKINPPKDNSKDELHQNLLYHSLQKSSDKKHQEHDHNHKDHECPTHLQKKAHTHHHQGNSHKHHKGHNHEGHNHEGHNHEGHNHEGHNHEGHNHEGHNHEGHNHEGHNHDHRDHSNQNKQSISMKAAILHALTDIIQSIGLLISALLIFFFGSDYGSIVKEFNNWHYLDPITTYVFSILVILSTWPITKQCYNIILQATPEEIDTLQIRKDFQFQEVKQLHDFHIWELRPGKILLTAHVFSATGKQKYVLQKLTRICRKYKIYHTTIQVEEWDSKFHEDYIRCENDIH